MNAGRRMPGPRRIIAGRRTLHVLRACFKCASFEPTRRTPVTSLLEGRSMVNVVPAKTKGSVYFRVPTLYGTNLAVIFSPLVSLVGSRISNLLIRGVPTTLVGDALARSRFGGAVCRMHDNGVGLLCVTPRQLDSGFFYGMLQTLPVTRIVISRTRYVSR